MSLITKYYQLAPKIINDDQEQPTWTTNMVISHFMHRLWGLRKRKVLKSILHCICKIFISPGNSSGREIAQMWTMQPIIQSICKSEESHFDSHRREATQVCTMQQIIQSSWTSEDSFALSQSAKVYKIGLIIHSS